MQMKKVDQKILALGKKTKAAWRILSLLSSAEKNKALVKMAKALLVREAFLIKENKKDLLAAHKANYSAALVDRLTLNEKRIAGMAQCLLDTAKLKDPVGEVMKSFTRPNGLKINKIRTPIGVIGIIYESRPNVTSDCMGLCLKSGNAAILKGGKEAVHSNKAIFSVLRKALEGTRIPRDAIALIDSTDRASVHQLLQMNDYVDLIVPRGGEGLIRYVCENSSIPVVKHYKGVCHTYVSDKADLKMAQAICVNAKVQRPGVCNAIETLLVHEKVAKKFLTHIMGELTDAGVSCRGCAQTRAILGKQVKRATRADWNAEYLDLILSIKVVKDTQAAIDHINTFGSQHSDAIITKNKKEAELFFRGVDSACLYVNASTRFTDGYEFGFGAEVGISTDKLHARGPMALEELTTYKYTIYGEGQIRS